MNKRSMNKMDKKQQIQEDLYHSFPYHYLARLGNGNFSQVKNLRWGYMYISYLSYVTEKLSKISLDRKSTRLNSSHSQQSRMPSSA